MPKVSVIVPVYNVEAYLDQCVKSILAQTLTDIEILLVNDASTDNSLKIAKSYERKDKRIKIIDKPHGGLGDTRNWGVRNAVGEYLAFVDSDDWIDADMLQNLYASAEGAQADLVVFNFMREDTVHNQRHECRLPIHYPDLNGETEDAVLASLIGPDATNSLWRSVEMLGCAWRRLYRREWFVESGLIYPNEQTVMLEDLPVTIKAHVLAERVLYLGGAYYHYRYNPDSLSTKYRPGKMEMLTNCFYMVQKFLQEKNMYRPYMERHLAWYLRMAAHSSLVNCFSPMNHVSVKKRMAEVAAIIKNPLLKEASASDYLSNGTKADQMILRVIRTGNTWIIYAFYKFYSNMLLKDNKKK